MGDDHDPTWPDAQVTHALEVLGAAGIDVPLLDALATARHELAALKAQNARLREALKKALGLPGLVSGAMTCDLGYHTTAATKYWAEAEAIETEARRALEEG